MKVRLFTVVLKIEVQPDDTEMLDAVAPVCPHAIRRLPLTREPGRAGVMVVEVPKEKAPAVTKVGARPALACTLSGETSPPFSISGFVFCPPSAASTPLLGEACSTEPDPGIALMFAEGVIGGM